MDSDNDPLPVQPEPEINYDDVATPSEPAVSLTAGASCDLFTFVIYVFVLGALCVFGLVGNTLAFLVLRSERRSRVATFLLQTMAVADNTFLTTTALSQMTMALTMYTETSLATAVAASPSETIDHRPLNDLYTVTAYVQVRWQIRVMGVAREGAGVLGPSQSEN